MKVTIKAITAENNYKVYKQTSLIKKYSKCVIKNTLISMTV